jgi:AmmeMemoRadiSam system protein B
MSSANLKFFPHMKKSSLSARCAGICYPTGVKEVRTFFDNFFGRPGEAPLPRSGSHPVLGCITPHIDFRVTTAAYGWAYQDLLQAPWADTYLILGVGHRSHIEWSTDARGYQTPLGLVETDEEALSLLQAGAPECFTHPSGHVGEHSIEFPLVCLQAFRQRLGCTKPFRFVPLLCGSLPHEVMLGEDPRKNEELQNLAKILRTWWDGKKGRVQVIVSIDGCHIGPRFQHAYDVTDSLLTLCGAWEERLWEKIEQRDLDGFLDHLRPDGNARYFDGAGALALFLTMFEKNFRLKRTHYAQWFEKRDRSAVTFTSGTLFPK